MIIKCWGSRGSIPVCGKEYIKYGGCTTCVEIRTKEDDIIIIDAGSGIRRLGNKLLEEGRSNFNIIFTHSHWDHILGFPFFKPIYFKKTSIKIFGCPFAQSSLKSFLEGTMKPPYFPVTFDTVKANITFYGSCENEFSINPVKITPILLSHPNQGIGYKFTEDNKNFVFLTDNELTYKHPGGLEYQDYVDFSRGSDLLIHDAEFTEEEYKITNKWGHSVYKDALRLALDAEVKQFGLFHHNQERTDKEVDKIVKDCKSIIKDKKSSLKCFGVYEGMEISL